MIASNANTTLVINISHDYTAHSKGRSRSGGFNLAVVKEVATISHTLGDRESRTFEKKRRILLVLSRVNKTNISDLTTHLSIETGLIKNETVDGVGVLTGIHKAVGCENGQNLRINRGERRCTLASCCLYQVYLYSSSVLGMFLS